MCGRPAGPGRGPPRGRPAKPAIIRDFPSPCPPRSCRRVLLLNKPYGVLCQFRSPDGRPTLADYVERPGVYPAGPPGRRQRRARRAHRRRRAAGAHHRSAPPPREDLLGRRWKASRPTTRSQRSRAASTLRDGPTQSADVRRLEPHAGAVAARPADPRAPRDPHRVARDRDPRRPQPAGAAHDRRGRPADAAARAHVGGAVDARRARAGRMARGERRARRAIIRRRFAVLLRRAARAPSRSAPPRSPMIRRLFARFWPGRSPGEPRHRARRRASGARATR